MYSIVLMAALTTGSTTPDCHWARGCHGGCYGGGYSGCWGGCYGGCYGGGHYGYGCGGGWHGHHGGYASTSYGCSGCYGGYGGWNCYGCAGGYANSYPMVAPVYQGAPVDRQPEVVPPPKKKNPDEVSNGSRAKVIVQLPADAKLFIDDHQMKATSATRAFQTPELEAGQVYYYVLRAEVVRDGQRKVETARVILRPGQVVRASFSTLDATDTTTVQASNKD